MAIGPDDVISDLESYIGLYDIRLSKESRKTFFDIEEFSCKCDYPCRYPLFFSKAIRNSKEIQKFIYSSGTNPNLSALQLEMGYYDGLGSDTNYQRGTILYSCKHDRDEHQNTAILDEAMQYCVRTERNVLEVHDILLAAMEVFEKQLRFKSGGDEGESNGSSEIMLFQVCEKHYDSLNISFNDMKRYIMNMDGKGRRFMLPGHIFR